MRIDPCTALLAFTLASALLTQTASTQITQAARPAARRAATPDATAQPAACNCPAPVVQEQRRYLPYSAKQTSTRVQTLANGTTITTVTTSQIWRDAEGRTRQEAVNTLTDGAQYRSVSINDPVERIQMNWTVGNPNAEKTVAVRHYPQPVARPSPTTAQVAQRYYPTTSESLPPQTIDGFYATGSRSTRTTPAGYVGNDRDIIGTTESWTAQPLGIQLRTISDDPRNGRITTETTDIQQTAPDPSLFQAPDGYQVRETNP